MTFNISVDSVTLPNTGDSSWDYQNQKWLEEWNKYSSGNTYPYYNYFTTTWPTTIYMYQLLCPECGTSNWGELDKIVECQGKKCKATLKAVSQQATHEIPINT